MQQSSIPILILLIAATVLAVIFGFSDLIVVAGRHIVSDNLLLDYALGVTWAAGLGLSILIWPVPNREKKPLILGWSAKCLVTLGFMLVYEYAYETDSFGYFFASSRASISWDYWSMGEGTTNFVQLVCLHSRLFPDSFHWMKVTFSMFGFLGVYSWYRAAVRFLGREDPRIFFALILFPSNLFWSSIISKDPVTFFFVGLYAFGVASWHSSGSLARLAISAFAIWGAMWFRYWLGPILVAPLGVFVFGRLRSLPSKVLFSCFVAYGFLFSATRFTEQLNIQSAQDVVATADSRMGGWEGGSGAAERTTFSSVRQMIAYWPYGTFSALFRPLPGEVRNAFGTLAGLENLLLLWLLLRAARRTSLTDLKEVPVLWTLGLILTWSTVYGLVSAQNLGAAVRFKLQILPALLCLLVYLGRSRRRTRTLEISHALPVARV